MKMQLVLWLTLLFAKLSAATIIYDGFADTTGLALNGSAATVSSSGQTVLRLVPAQTFRGGSAFSLNPVNAADFSTFFQFQFTSPGGSGGGADGLAFVIQPVSNTVGAAGGGLGYQGVSPSFAVEFDIFQNSWDPNDSHVATATNGQATATNTPVSVSQMKDGAVRYAWIDYDGTSLSVRLNTTNQRPLDALLTQTVNIASILGQSTAFVGFTAGTGNGVANHDVLYFAYNTEFDPIGDPPPTGIPEPGSLALTTAGGLALLWASLKRKR